ncbi:unnamed protein product, partial [Prorocentrum cordatum]
AANTSRQIRQEREDHRAKLGEDRGSIDKDVAHGRRRFTLEREKFRSEYEIAERERQRISDHNVATETMVDLNVGGVIFEAARHTCTQQPGSLLERLLTGRASAPRDRDGRIFLDRDSNLFRMILNFLREPAQPPPAPDPSTSEALCAEARAGPAPKGSRRVEEDRGSRVDEHRGPLPFLLLLLLPVLVVVVVVVLLLLLLLVGLLLLHLLLLFLLL